jgi:hypothetical protein
MAALLLYARYAEFPMLQRYLAVAFAFALGLMAKPMLVTFPLILLLLDYWPLRRLDWPPAWRKAKPLVEARAEFGEALRLNPHLAEAREALAKIAGN